MKQKIGSGAGLLALLLCMGTALLLTACRSTVPAEGGGSVLSSGTESGAAVSRAEGEDASTTVPDIDYYDLVLNGDREGCRWQYVETEEGKLRLNVTYDYGETLLPTPVWDGREENQPEGERFFITRTVTALLDGGYYSEAAGKIVPLTLHYIADQGQSWQTTALPVPEGESYPMQFIGFTTPREGWLVLGGEVSEGRQKNRVFLTNDGGGTWTETGNTTEQYDALLAGANFLDKETGFLTFRYLNEPEPVVYRTGDAGKSWEKCPVKIDEGWKPYHSAVAQSPYFDGQNGVTELALDSDAESGGGRSAFLYTTDAGRSWFTEIAIPRLDESLTAADLKSSSVTIDGTARSFTDREHGTYLLNGIRYLSDRHPARRYTSLEDAYPDGVPTPALAYELQFQDGSVVRAECYREAPGALLYEVGGVKRYYQVDPDWIGEQLDWLSLVLPDLASSGIDDSRVREKLHAIGFTDEMIDFFSYEDVDDLLSVTPERFQSEFLPVYQERQERIAEALARPKAQDAYTGGDGAFSIGVAPLDYEFAGDGHENNYLVGYENATGKSWLLDEIFYGNFVHNRDDDLLLDNEISRLTAYDLKTGRKAELQLDFDWGGRNAQGEPANYVVGAVYDAAGGYYAVFYRANTYDQQTDEPLRLAVFDRQGTRVNDLDTGAAIAAYSKNFVVMVTHIAFSGDGKVAFDAASSQGERRVEISYLP